MERHARYTLIGAFTLASIVGGFLFVYWIKNAGGIGQRALYDIHFEQPVSGLITGADVLFNGVRAGTVAQIQLDPNNPTTVGVTISVSPETPVRSDTQVDIAYQGIAGVAAISLKGGSAQAPQLISRDGHPPLIVAGKDVGRNLTESAQQTLRHIDEILDQNSKPLNSALTGIATFADMLGRNSTRVEGLLGALENLTGGGTSKASTVLYDLKPATDFPRTKPIKKRLVIPDPNAVILFDSQKILVRSGSETYSDLGNARWIDNLPKLIQARIVQSFENAQQLDAVSRPSEQATAGYRLEITIRNFELALQPSPNALVDLTARLINDKGDIIAARVFATNVPAKSTEEAEVVAAINKAFSQVAADIVIWTIGTV
ncbi:MAG TPA: ABC-type transport auxiliary lipoprotein family protein [Pseudolabrys sp.]|nr:ABC-type transport auxiliary lipoprotein family protein [Pseudolabrys sp.]